MDKLLLMSIQSSSPAEVSAGGSWMDWLISETKMVGKEASSDHGGSSNTKTGAAAAGGERNRQPDVDQKPRREPQRRLAAAPCLAPEFDGLNWFETLVSH